MNDTELENALHAAGKTAPRVTPADIEAQIIGEHYFTALEGIKGAGTFTESMQNGDGTPQHVLDTILAAQAPLLYLTFCVLVLRNGFTVVGKSACAHPETFDAEIGRKLARDDAKRQVWPLLGFRLRDQLSAAPADYRDRVRQEAADLDEKLVKLRAFFETDKFGELPEPEREHLAMQHIAMSEYRYALSKRIAAFPT